jgi:TRAP-type C4-dicarboxylate transport system substrate-binding protein
MKRSLLATSLLVAVVALVALCIGTSVQAQQKPVTMNYSNLFPANHKHSILADQWAQEIEKRTNGKVKITVFHGGTLTQPPMAWDGVVKGLSDLALGVFSYSRGRFPLTEVLDLPLGFKSGYMATKLANEYYRKFAPKEMDDVKVMYLHAHGPAILHTAKKQVTKLEDMKGVKVRVTPLATPVLAALGATPVAMPMGDTYDSLSKGVVDGAFSPYEALEGWKWGEIVKYSTECYGISPSSGFYVVMNKKKWQSLPADIQKTIEKVNEEWIEKQGKVWDEIDKEGRAFAIKKGQKPIALSAAEQERWVKAVKPVLDDYVKRTKAKGLPGDEVLKFAQDYLKKHQK